MQKNFFTLIELLVVIAIITILAAILLPALSKARNRSKLATCTSNLKQIGTAMAMYTGDAEGFFPVARNGVVGSKRFYSYDRSLLPYLGYKDKDPWAEYIFDPNNQTIKVFSCPAQPSPSHGWAIRDGLTLRSYAINNLGTNANTSNGISGWSRSVKDTMVRRPTQVIALMEYEASVDNEASYVGRPAQSTYSGGHYARTGLIGNLKPQVFSLIHSWHESGRWANNFLLVDGHVAVLPWQETVRGGNLSGYYYRNTMWDYTKKK